MSKNFKNKIVNLSLFAYTLFSIMVFLFIVVLIQFRYEHFPNKSIENYFKIFRAKDVVLDGQTLDPEELNILEKCKDQKCFRNYFYNYNISHDLVSTLSNMTELLRQKPEYYDYCHQISHGIGNSELIKQKGDLRKSFELYYQTSFMRNYATCGAGFLHGLIEYYGKDIKDDNVLVKRMSNICSEPFVKTRDYLECIHSLGHMFYMQTEYNIPKSMDLCDRTVSSDSFKYYCYSGVMMQVNSELPVEMLLSYENDTLDFKICDGLVDFTQLRACYSRTVSQFGKLVSNPENYGARMNLCTKISDNILRLDCVKNLAVMSIIGGNYKDLQNLCMKSGLTSKEEISCVIMYASLLGRAMDASKGQIYYDSAIDVCRNLPILSQKECIDAINSNGKDIYLATVGIQF